MAKSKDLFDDSTMSFGEHLEVLRTHLWKALIGTAVCVLIALFIGNDVVAIVRKPIDDALAEYGVKATDNVPDFDLWTYIKAKFGNVEAQETIANQEAARQKAIDEEKKAIESATFTLDVRVSDLAKALHELDAEKYPLPANESDKTVALEVQSEELGAIAGTLNDVEKNQHRPVTLEVQEAFMTYLKVSLIASVILASPWIFYQLWLFVAAGLYQHERKFVYIYGTMSLFLFLAGAAFCFYAVFPFVLKFLLAFNRNIGVTPQIRLSEWISFAVVLPLMFGISFQLPLVMKFLTAISIFNVEVYRKNWRLAVLVIAFLSMVLTPADPFSMLLMMFPLLFLYQLGIWLCQVSARKNPFEGEPA